MQFIRFGELYLDPNQIQYVRRFMPEIQGPARDDAGGLRLGFEQREITVYDDDPGFAELIAWLEGNSQTPA